MTDLLRKVEHLATPDVTLVLNYRLDFDAEKSCGSIVVYQGKPDAEDPFETYMEHIECGLSEEDVMKRFERTINEVREGNLDVTL